ncbi:MAG: S9 family peptidase [Pseudopedobacter saltans]|uniref:S9 family peptidase n=1 Tax=Pseudopedobacter saltans TaxID=151895 RepID=A0A2W5F3B5_9SPHI|nr:MAG: S9 family peptidase [Pseudopedobacter saltans]
MLRKTCWLFFCLFSLCHLQSNAQFGPKYNWTEDGNGFYFFEDGKISQRNLNTLQAEEILSSDALTPKDSSKPLSIEKFYFSADKKNILLFTNTERVWRYNTRGDYWVLNVASKKLTKLGKGLPVSSLMYAKFSPDGKYVGYGSKHNLYMEDIATGKIKQLTKDGTDRLINATFDWAYEEEFGCRDGFRWSPDSKSIAYWQVDARKIRNFLMINNTDSIYSFTIPVEYPVVGETPSPTKVGVVNITSGVTTWMNVPGNPAQNYLPRMEWAGNESIVLQQLNRKQNQSTLYYANIKTGKANAFYTENDKAWIDIKSRWNGDDPMGWDWMPDMKSFVWVSEKDGWRHIFLVNRDGKKETLITKGNFDIIQIYTIDVQNGYVYYAASPDNATQNYLYRSKLDGNGAAERLSPLNQSGTHDYEISPNGKFAEHGFSNANALPISEWVTLPEHKTIAGSQPRELPAGFPKVEFGKLKLDDTHDADYWMVKPTNFDPNKKYPIVFTVYTEPAGQTVLDRWGSGRNGLYNGDMAKDGYIYVSIDGRGTPAPKGAEWRKSIYKKIGIINIDDQATAAKQILALPYVDTSRVAVHGWSGGGSTTLNLLFKYPELYKTGISVAPVANQLTYDNIYEERYMGLPQEDKQPYIDGSPITHAKNLKGNLLLIHGTGDDNVHYQNSEMLINQLIKYDKVFEFMAYPNRTHSISEGEGTSKHLRTIFTEYLKRNCPPGAK